MLVGNNELRLNQAVMVKTLQHYFETVLFKPGAVPKVVRVDLVSGSMQNSDNFAVAVQMPDVVLDVAGVPVERTHK